MEEKILEKLDAIDRKLDSLLSQVERAEIKADKLTNQVRAIIDKILK